MLVTSATKMPAGRPEAISTRHVVVPCGIRRAARTIEDAVRREIFEESGIAAPM